MSGPIALNDKGEAMFFDGKAWQPSQIATNDAGDRMAFNGTDWERLGPEPSIGKQVWEGVKSAGAEAGDFYKRAGEYRDTQLAKAVGGIAGVPRMLAQGADWFMRKTGMTPDLGQGDPTEGILPSSDQATHFMLGHLPGQQRTINPVVDAAVQGLITGPALGVGGKLGPALNAGAGAGSEALGQLAHEYLPKWETPARIFGALAGGGAGVGVGALTGKIGATSKAMVAPFTLSGRDALVSDALRTAASDPQAAATAIDQKMAGQAAYPTNVPGFQLNAGQASRDPGLLAASETIPQAQRGPVANENNVALTSALDRVGAGLPDNPGAVIQNQLGNTVEGMKAVRGLETNPLYEAAKKNPTPVKPFPLMAYTADALESTKGDVNRTVNEARSLLFKKDANGRTIPDRSAAGMIATDKALGAMLEREGLDSESRSLLMEMKKKTEEALNVVPPARQAKARYAELSRPLDPFNPDLGDLNKTLAGVVERNPYNTGFTMPAENVPGALMKGGPVGPAMVKHLIDASGGNPAVKSALQAAYINDFKRAASSPVAEDAIGNSRLTASGAARWMEKHRAGAANVLTPEQLAALDEVKQHLTDVAQTPPARSGSPTFDRLATNSIIGAALSPKLSKVPFMHGVNKALGFVYGGANEAAQSRLYEALQDPALARMLMLKATPGNAKLAEPLLRRLAAQGVVPLSRSDERAAQ